MVKKQLMVSTLALWISIAEFEQKSMVEVVMNRSTVNMSTTKWTADLSNWNLTSEKGISLIRIGYAGLDF